MNFDNNQSGLEIAVIGVAGRFPKADTITEFWENLKNGVECISFFSDEELEEAGISPDLYKKPNFVKAKAILGDIENFDASFFGFTPGDAKTTDPQSRLFLECAWEAMEDGGYEPQSYDGLIGAFMGAADSVYWKARHLLHFMSSGETDFLRFVYQDKDFMSLLGGYKLNLRGPCFTLATACSSSLVAIHVACQAVLNGECDMALAGGVRISLPKKDGYLYEKGMIRSSDGRCRAFDAGAQGFSRGSGAGIVLLKRLEDALDDGDHIYAVVKGSAINNDGYRKVGFTAPSIEGQTEVIRLAHQMAQVEPDSITYVEAHGAGTILGDPMEVQALQTAFNTEKRGFCGLGSIKTNMGHLDAAAGVAGFMKTIMAIHHRSLPPTLNFAKPNPKIDFENSPFYVVDRLIEWKRGEYPLRAGVSSFGIGGTNAHIILEEAPQVMSTPHQKPYLMLQLSARTPTALRKQSENLVEYLKQNPRINLADAAFTLQVGRKEFPHRQVAICTDVESAVNVLSATTRRNINRLSAHTGDEKKSVIFLFSGMGAQYVGMARELYESEVCFRENMDRCFEILRPLQQVDLKELSFPSTPVTPETEERFQQMEIAQTVVFAVEYSLARLLMEWGIHPQAMIGYSLGEYTAAAVAGVMTLEDTMKVLVHRGQLLDRLPPGAMLSVPVPKDEILPHLTGELELAIDNGTSSIVAGPLQQMEAFEQRMKQQRYMCYRLSSRFAVHSSITEAIADEFESYMSNITLNKPEIPYISNVTGNWIAEKDVTDPSYWARHLKQTVRFAEGIETLLKQENPLFLEIGPGNSLTTMLGRYKEKNKSLEILNLLRPKDQEQSDTQLLLKRLGQLWLAGVTVDWMKYYAGEKRMRTSLPTYPFERQRYWLEGNPFEIVAQVVSRKSGLSGSSDVRDWYYQPVWLRSLPRHIDQATAQTASWLVFPDQNRRGSSITERLRQENHDVTVVEIGDEYRQTAPNSYCVNPGNGSDFTKLVTALTESGTHPQKVLYFYDSSDGLCHMVQLERLPLPNGTPVHLIIVTTDQFSVTGREEICPANARLQEVLKQLENRHDNIRCRIIDFESPTSGHSLDDMQENQLWMELQKETPEQVTAYRGKFRWVQSMKNVRLDEGNNNDPVLKEGGVYMITGALRGLGADIAVFLGLKVNARLILADDISFPPRAKWIEYIEQESSTGQNVRKLQRLANNGVQFTIHQTTLSDIDSVRCLLEEAEKTYGPIDGVIHSEVTREAETVEHPAGSVERLLTLDRALGDRPLAFFSAISTIDGGYYRDRVGGGNYSPGNAVADALAYARQARGEFAVSIAWGDRSEEGIPGAEKYAVLTSISRENIGIALTQILMQNSPVVMVSPVDPKKITQLNKEKMEGTEKKSHSLEIQQAVPELRLDLQQERPALSTEYEPPVTETQEQVVRIWQRIFGVEDIGIDDNFFELGGDSLRAINVVTKIRSVFGTEVSVNEFFDRNTIRKISECIDGAQKNAFIKIDTAQQKVHYPLSPTQQQLYHLQQIQGWQYHTLGISVFTEPVERESIEAAFLELIRRHDTLRTAIEEIEGEPVQQIRQETNFKLGYYDENNADIAEIIEELTEPFDLTRPPLLRAALIKRTTNEYNLVLNILWLITDGQSKDIIVEELSGLMQGKPLPAVGFQYKDFSEWQNSEKGRAAIEKQEAMWRQKFTGQMPSMPALPFDYPASDRYMFEERTLHFLLEKEETEALKAIALEQESTLYMVIYSIFSIMLARVCGQEEILVTTNLIGRRHEDFKRIIGRFVNTLPIVTEPKPELNLIQYLRQVRKTILEVFENQEYVLEDIYRKIAEKEGGYRNPIYGVMYRFNNRTTPRDAPEPTNINDTLYKDGNAAAAKNVNATGSELALNGTETGDGIRLSFNYNINLFREETIHKFIRVFRRIADGLVSDKNQKIADIEIHELHAESIAAN